MGSQVNAFYSCDFVLYHSFQSTGNRFSITLTQYYLSHCVIRDNVSSRLDYYDCFLYFSL